MKFELTTIDYAVIGFYFAFMLWHGWRASKEHRKEGEGAKAYFLASRNLPWYLIGFSLYASNMSGSSFIGLMGASYAHGFTVFHYEWTATLILLFFALFMLPRFLARGIATLPEFLESRYSPEARRLYSLFTIFAIIFIDTSGALYAGGLVTTQIIPQISLFQAILGLGLITGLYTMVGGLKAVVVIETFQAVLLIAGGACIVWFGLDAVGGWDALMQGVDDTKKQWIRPMDDAFMPWTGIFGIILLGMYYWTMNQFIAQRTLGARTLRDGQVGSLFAGLLKLPNFFLMIIPGMIALVLYPNLKSPDLAFPTLVAELMPVGVRGLVLTGLIAATMSSIESALNAAASLITLDFVHKVKPEWGDRRLRIVGQIVTFTIMLIAIFYAPVIAKFPNLFEYVQSVLAYIIPSIVAVYLLGLFSDRINNRAAVVVLIFGFIVGVGWFAVTQIPVLTRAMSLPSIHYTNMAAILFIFWVVMAYAISLFGKRPHENKLQSAFPEPKPGDSLAEMEPMSVER